MDHKTAESHIKSAISFYEKRAENIFGREFPKVQCNYSYRKSRTAGLAHLSPVVFNSFKITINVPLLAVNDNSKQIYETVGHEIAHLIAFDMYNDRGHGRAWKRVMVQLGLHPERCHQMDEAAAMVGKNTTKYIYRCSGCGTYLPLGSKRHKRLQNSPNRLLHRCGRGVTGNLEFVCQSNAVTWAKYKNGEIRADQLMTGKIDHLFTNKDSKRTNHQTSNVAAQQANKGSTSVRTTKLQRAQLIYLAMKDYASRQEIINRFIDDLDMTKAGASTYYHKVKSLLSTVDN